MTGTLIVDVLGLRVGIDAGEDLDGAQRDDVASAWSGALTSGHGSVDLTVPFRPGDDFDRAMERLTVDVTLAALHARRGSSLMFHAAGVADEAGRVAAFVGPSGRGKTTLSRALGEHYGYVSDEAVAVDADRRVQPYRKPLSVVRERAPKKQVSPAEAGLKALPDAPLHLSALVLLDRDPRLTEPEVLPVSLAEALPELVPQMSYLRSHARPLHAIAALCTTIGGVRRLRYPDASTVPVMLPELLDAPFGPSDWAPVPPATDTGPFDTSGVADAILTDGFLIVMAEAVVHVLDGIAPVIWLAAAQGHDLDGIVQSVTAEFGAPPEGDARTLVQGALQELMGAGVLRQR